MKVDKTITSAIVAILLLFATGCAPELKENEKKDSSLALLLLPAAGLSHQNTCVGGLHLFTDPMPEEGEIPVIPLGGAIVLDQSGYGNSADLTWDFLASTEYHGLYQRYANDVKAENCAGYQPMFPGFHYLKLCNASTCVARGIVKVEGEMNQAPHIDLAPIPLVVPVGVSQLLDLSASTDPENDALSFEWQLQIRPANSLMNAPSSGPAVQSFTPDVPGKYFLMGRARDGFENPFRFLDEGGHSIVSALMYSRIPGNAAPTMVLNVTPVNPVETQGVTFDASASTDTDNPVLFIHSWTLVRLNKDNSGEVIREGADLPAGQLTFTIAPEAGSYEMYICLGDYVGRETGVPGEEQSCDVKAFTVNP